MLRYSLLLLLPFYTLLTGYLAVTLSLSIIVNLVVISDAEL
jgi:hypothetical protein